MFRSRRIVVGLVALTLAAAGVVLLVADRQVGGGVLLRTAAILGAIWVAYPALAKLKWSWVALALVALLVFIAGRGR